MSPRWPTLAEHLRASGYKTYAGVSERNHYGGGAPFGLDRGFDENVPGAAYNQHMPWTEEFVVSRFREHHASGPCFVYVHINDSHEPFDPPEPWLGMWGDSYHARYEAELSYVDHYLGRIFSSLKEMNIWDRTLVVVQSDHGSEFWEHEFIEKKVNLYNEILHVPLIMHLPGALPAGRVVEGLAETAQISPTILDILGLDPLPDAQARSFWPRVAGHGEAPEHICSHTMHEHQRDHGPAQFDHYAIQTPEWKFIRIELHAEPDDLWSDWRQRFQAIMLRAGRDPSELAAGTVIRELYDLVVDPGEHRSMLHPEEALGGRRSYTHRLAPEAYVRVSRDLEQKLDQWIYETTAWRDQ